MKYIYRGGILGGWITVLVVPPLLYYHDRKLYKEKLLQPVYFFDQMEFMKNFVDDNPKNHVIDDVPSSIQNHLFCRLIPISTAHTTAGFISI